MYEAIQDVLENHVVTHENDRAWRNAVVTNKPSLLALRYSVNNSVCAVILKSFLILLTIAGTI